MTEPSVRARTEVISPEGSACAIEPTVVPRLRIAGWATFAVARASSGWTRAAASSCEQCVVADQRSHRHAVPGGLDGVEAGHPVDVHQRGRRREPHGEQREQRLATGEHLGARTLVGRGPRGPRRGCRGRRNGRELVSPVVRALSMVACRERPGGRPRRRTTGRAPRSSASRRRAPWRHGVAVVAERGPRPGACPRAAAPPSCRPARGPGRRASATTATIEPSAIPREGEVRR